MGGLPDYGNHDFAAMIEKWTSAGKLVTMSTQVTHEGSDMGIYKVGKVIKENFEILESYDMTLEATVTKMMWILAQREILRNARNCFIRQSTKIFYFKEKLQEPVHPLLFTPFSATRFAMHRIYADRINSRGMSRVFCDLRSQKNTSRNITSEQ